MITEAALISGAKKVFGDLVSKVVSDGVDISKNAIKNADQDRKSDNQNLQIQMYHVIVDSLNKFTYNKYEKSDKLYDAAESVLKGLMNGKCDTDAIRPGLKMLVLDVDIDSCKDFLEILDHEICKDEKTVLYKEFELLRERQLSEYIHDGFEKNEQAHIKTNRKLENVIEKLNGYMERDQSNANIVMLQDCEREFVVTRNVNVKPVSYFTGREVEIKELRQKIEDGCKAILVSGMGGIGKTHICRKLFEEYLNKFTQEGSRAFRHIGYIVYNENMEYSLQRCLKYKEQNDSGQNLEAAWRELEYLASDGKLLLFVDNVNTPIKDDPGLQRLKNIPGTIVMTSRLASMGDEFETYSVDLLDLEQCKEIYGKIRYKNKRGRLKNEDIEDLQFIIEILAGRHTITVEHLANLARIKVWSAKELREEVDKKKFQLTYHKDGEQINIQNLYEALYDLSDLPWEKQNILEAFSTLPYIPLPMDICNKWLLKDAKASEDDDILMGLCDSGWLQFDVESEGFSMHPVFAQFINEKCKPKEERHLGLIEACKQSMETKGIRKDIIFYCPFVLSIAKKLQPAGNTRLYELLSTMIAIAKDVKIELEESIDESINMINGVTVLDEEISAFLEMLEERQRLFEQLRELNSSIEENPDIIDVEKVAAFRTAILNMEIGSLKARLSRMKELINGIKAEKLGFEAQEFKEYINSAELENTVTALDAIEWEELRDLWIGM